MIFIVFHVDSIPIFLYIEVSIHRLSLQVGLIRKDCAWHLLDSSHCATDTVLVNSAYDSFWALLLEELTAHLVINCGLIETKLSTRSLDTSRSSVATHVICINYISLGLCVTHVHLAITTSSLHLVCFLVFELLEVGHNICDRFFVHGNSLLQDVKSPWNDIKLAYDFLESLRKLFSASTNSIVLLHHSHWLLDCSSSTCDWCLRFGRRIHSGSWFLSSFWGWSSFCSWWSLLVNWRHSSHLLIIISSFGSEIFNELLFILIEITFPNHDYGVRTTSGKVVTTRRKVCRGGRALMTIKRIQNMTLSKIPNLKGWIGTTWE